MVNIFLLPFLLFFPSVADPSTYKDESDIFFEDPYKFLSTRFQSEATQIYGNDGVKHVARKGKDSHLVIFEDLIRTHSDTIPAWFLSQGYKEVSKTHNLTMTLKQRRNEVS